MEVDPKLNELAVSNFRKYLKIPTVQPDVDYDEAIGFLQSLAKDIGLQARIFQYFPKKPILIITWVGQNPDLPSILLNSHMDVVPVFKEKWTHEPFGAEMDEKGDIYARGAQDTKATAIQYLEAIRRLKKNGVRLERTVHVSLVPDEEIGGEQGMKVFATTDDFKELNLGFAIDEGVPSLNTEFVYFSGERAQCQMCFHCPGKTMHGSLLTEDTAGEKVRHVLEKLYDFRTIELNKLKTLKIGDVTTMNVTQLQGGVQTNVVPPEFRIFVDCRVSVALSMDKLEHIVKDWCKTAGEGVWVDLTKREDHAPLTKVDNTNPYWVAFESAAQKLNIIIKHHIMPASTDARYVRKAGVPAINFSPMNLTPILAHAHDEYLNVKVFLRGIEIFYGIINELGNL